MRYALAIFFAIVLFSPMVLRWSMGRTDGAAPPGNALKLVIITPHGEPIRREFEEAFNAYHVERFGPPVDIVYQLIGGGGGAEMRRTLEALAATEYARNGTYGIDLAWGGGDSLFDRDLKPHLEAIGPRVTAQPWSYLPSGAMHPTRLMQDMRTKAGLAPLERR